MEKICDLHTHSVFSDGTCTPTQIVNAAEELGLAAVALCDHNTVDGLPEFLSAAQDKNVEAIAGAEFSVDYDGTELHLLGLFIRPKHFREISCLMEEVTESKRKSNLALIGALNKAGYQIDYDVICGATPNGKFNRSHVAAELTRKGYTASRDHAFATLLSPSAGFYTEPKRLAFWDMLEYLTDMEIIPVLAHPFLNLRESELEELLPLAKEKGLKGMECRYPLYDDRTTRKALELANRFGLKKSGGSDFHGENKPNIALGSGTGDLRIPYAWATALAAAE